MEAILVVGIGKEHTRIWPKQTYSHSHSTKHKTIKEHAKQRKLFEHGTTTHIARRVEGTVPTDEDPPKGIGEVLGALGDVNRISRIADEQTRRRR